MRLALRYSALALWALAAACAPSPSLLETSVHEAQACTAGVCSRAANPSAVTEGMDLGGVQAFRETVCTPMARTISDGGTFPVATLVDAGVCSSWLMDPNIDGANDAGWGWNSSLDWIPDLGAQCSSRDFLSPAWMRGGWRVAVVCTGVKESIADAGVGYLNVNINGIQKAAGY